MNQIKIGKFIAELRKEKELTQKELADKIGVTDRAISKWENGRGMPDVSLLRDLSNELSISVTELLSGERIDNKDELERLEDNMINAIDSRVRLQNDVTGYLLLKVVAFILLFLAWALFHINAIWINLIILAGMGFIIASSLKLVKSWYLVPKIIYLVVVFVLMIGVFKYAEYMFLVDEELSYPHFYYQKKERENCVVYKTIGYSCIKYKSDDEERKKTFQNGICNIVIDEDPEETLNSHFCDYSYVEEYKEKLKEYELNNSNE